MNPNQYTLSEIGEAFGDKEYIVSKYKPRFPESPEREYRRLINQYMLMMKEEIETQLPTLKEVYRKERNANVKEMRNDGVTDLMMAITKVFNEMANNITKKLAKFEMDTKIRKVSAQAKRMSVNEWRTAVKRTFNVNLKEDYFLGDFYSNEIEKWVGENVALISGLHGETLEKMKQIIYQGFDSGKTSTAMMNDIKAAYSMSTRDARYIARDQLGKLHSEITKAQHQACGVTRYKWLTVHDERVRDCHDELDGKIFSYDDPPEMWYDTKNGRVYTGRKCNPGEDYGCRCVAIPVFEKSSIELPMETEK